MTDVRLVPMTRGDRDDAEIRRDDHLVAAWDAAPPDPAEVIHATLEDNLEGDFWAFKEATDEVLTRLGYPANPEAT